jgi:hypothetical protein
MRGQNRNVTVLLDVDVTCAENASKYVPPSLNTMRLAGDPCEIPLDIGGASYVTAYAVFADAAFMLLFWPKNA